MRAATSDILKRPPIAGSGGSIQGVKCAVDLRLGGYPGLEQARLPLAFMLLVAERVLGWV